MCECHYYLQVSAETGSNDLSEVVERWGCCCPCTLPTKETSNAGEQWRHIVYLAPYEVAVEEADGDADAV